MATFVHQDHVKKPTVPETVTGDLGTSKRNIIRKGGPGKTRKEGAAASAVDDGSTYADPSSFDQRDPNYDSEQETGREDVPRLSALLREDVGKSKMTLTAYKKVVEPIITEYFVSGDVDDVLVSIQEIGAPEYSYECVKRSINMSFDKADHERELISQMLSIGYPDIFSSNMIGKGFERLFEIIDEIEKDAPAARDLLAKFLGRAVVDEVLPPSFLSDAVVCNLGGTVRANIFPSP
jgi:programmed cell death protein 4